MVNAEVPNCAMENVQNTRVRKNQYDGSTTAKSDIAFIVCFLEDDADTYLHYHAETSQMICSEIYHESRRH